MEQMDAGLREQNKHLRVLSCVLMYVVCMAIYVLYVVLYKLTEGEYLFIHTILFFGAILLPVIYHIAFLVVHRKEWQWHYEQVLVSFVMSIVCAILLYVLINNFPSYSGWDHFLDGIELLFLIVESLLRFIYVPIITYAAWRIRNHGQKIRLIDYYPKWAVILITIIGWLSIIIAIILLGLMISGI